MGSRQNQAGASLFAGGGDQAIIEQIQATEIGSELGPFGDPVPEECSESERGGFGTWSPAFRACGECAVSGMCVVRTFGLRPRVGVNLKKVKGLKRAPDEANPFLHSSSYRGPFNSWLAEVNACKKRLPQTVERSIVEGLWLEDELDNGGLADAYKEHLVISDGEFQYLPKEIKEILRNPTNF